MIERYCRLGISPGLLYPEMFSGNLAHLAGFTKAVSLPGYEVLETFLADDAAVRKEELKLAREEGKLLSYNMVTAIQIPGPYNPCSFDEKERMRAAELMMRHLDYAVEAGSPVFLVTSGPDYRPEDREGEKRNLASFYHTVAPYAAQRGIEICIEPTERHRFKKQLLGPTPECITFLRQLRSEGGCDNVSLMVDTAHFPMMGENTIESIDLVAKNGPLGYVHVGNAVLDPKSEFYGHTHPPVGIVGGVCDVSSLAETFKELFQVGYLDSFVEYEKRPRLSYEMKPYPGVSERTSARFAYEKADAAMRMALGVQS